MHAPPAPSQVDTMLPERFAIALHATARAWRLGLDARLKNLGIGQAGWLAIAAIAKSTPELSQRAIAERLGVEAASMVAMIDRLESLGLVERMPCRSDRRIKLVRLTASGCKLHGKVQAEANAFRTNILAGVDSAHLEQVAELLVRLNGDIERELGNLSPRGRQKKGCVTLAPSVFQ
ncbi:MarR family winged helix-turn-helix transcriptional regulator [Massilia aerilata]|uniref:MarR family winged helix-turn-helix transcriptional regulator n=1 Tax=Massilia aerilata TaxID=453817 RepID=A0ABW0RZS9_9BURK